MSVHSAATKESFVAVEFRYDQALPNITGDGFGQFAKQVVTNTFQRFTNWSSDVFVNGQKYTSLVTMGIELPNNTGVFKEKDAGIELPFTANGFTDKSSNGEPFAPMFLTIYEFARPVDGSNQSSDLLTLFAGRVIRTLRNYQGRNGVVRYEAQSAKSRLNVPLGLVANHHCVWTLGGRGCAGLGFTAGGSPIVGASVFYSQQRIGTVTTITGKRVTLADIFDDGSGDLNMFPWSTLTAGFWSRGFLERKGVRLLIRQWLKPGATNTFDLVREPPAEWINQRVRLYPGCDKTVQTCRSRWNNEAQFGGMGYAVPAYNPILESPN